METMTQDFIEKVRSAGILVCFFLATSILSPGCEKQPVEREHSQTNPQDPAALTEIERYAKECWAAPTAFKKAESCIAQAKLTGEVQLKLDRLGLERVPEGIGGNQLRNVPQSFANLQNLRTVTAIYNKIETLPQEWCRIEHFFILLNGNPLTEKAFREQCKHKTQSSN